MRNRSRPLGLPAALLALLAAPAAAVQDDQADLEARYEKKLAKEFVTHGGWITDYEEARAAARKEDKVLFVYFSRSYAP